MRSRLIAVVVSVLLLSASLASGVVNAQTGPPVVPDQLRAFAIDPPGQEGNVTTDEFITGDYGPHYQDQLEMYAGLIDDDDVTEDDLLTHFHSMQFGPGTEYEDPYSPREGVTVYRDTFGVPHIYADSIENASFALGYVTAEDRMFEMDAFRHAARGTLAEFAGPGTDDANLKMDIDTRREGYTEAEVQQMYDDFDDKFGELGVTVQNGLTAYADGVNARIAEIREDPSQCDVAYQATGNVCPAEDPEDWTVLDTLFLVVLQLRVFGETAGGELQNAGFYAHLTEKLGNKLGPKVYNDLMRINDPKSPTSIERSEAIFPSQDLGEVDPASFAIPDKAEAAAEEEEQRQQRRMEVLGSLGFPTGPTSNALLVGAEESVTGNPLQIGAPQVGYAVPSFFMEVDVHSPGVDFRGPAVPGASALIPLGRGADYAWSLTTGYSDAVDTRVELLCDPAGGEPTVESTGYVFNDACVEMESREETFNVNPTATDPGPPSSETHTFYRTVHGPVFERGKVDGKPVAFVKERFFWKREVDSVPQFYRWNAEVDSIEDFAAAAEDFTMSFNSFYADSEDIGYFHVGFYPQRPQGVHPSLPTWGTGDWEWQGRLPFDQHPKVINPASGWVANWNNKPSVGWDNYDGAKWGRINRVGLLKGKMRALLADEGKAQLTDLVDVIRAAATQDTRGVYLAPKMIKFIKAADGVEKELKDGVAVVDEWVKAGANRTNKDRDDNMDNGPALALFDAWYETLVHKVFDDELGPEGLDLIGAPITDYSPEQGSSWWFDFSTYLKNLFKRKTRNAYARNYCDDMTTGKVETCALQALRALEDAYNLVKADQGPVMADWTKPAENIVFQEFGAGSVDPIPWQNRGTHNHVVEVLGDASP